jgi:hypothetical protein
MLDLIPMHKYLLLLLITFQAFSSYIDEHGHFHREWFAYNHDVVEKQVRDKKEFYSDAYFKAWFKSSDIALNTTNALLGSSQSRARVLSGCSVREDICKVLSTFGQKKSYRMLYLYEEYGYNPSQYYENRDFAAQYDEFTIDEINDVVIAFSFFSKERLKRNYKKFIRVTNYSLGNSIANGRIHLFKKWRELSSTGRVAVIVHELGHNIAYQRSPNNIPAFSSYQTSDEWSDLYESQCHLSKYGMASKYEGFAEAVSLFKLDPVLLREVCPGKYAFMRRVFSE